MIEKERLEELIEQGATIGVYDYSYSWYDKPNKHEKRNKEKQSENKIYTWIFFLP